MKNEDFGSLEILINNTPLDDFCGLTPNEMHRILYDEYGKDAPIRLCDFILDETLDKIPFFILTEAFLKIVQREKEIKLTATGALPKKIVHEIYDMKIIVDAVIEEGLYKLNKESDSIVISSLHTNTQFAGLIRKLKGKITLTKKGEKLMEPANRSELFKKVLQSFTNKFNWGSFDGYSEFPAGQVGWPYSVYLLFKFGEEPQTMQFYADKYQQAFPNVMQHFPFEGYGSPKEVFSRCYSHRVFEKFLDWFGLVLLEKERGLAITPDRKLIASEILSLVFYLD